MEVFCVCVRIHTLLKLVNFTSSDSIRNRLKIVFWTFSFAFRHLISLIPFDCWEETSYQIHYEFQKISPYIVNLIILKLCVHSKQTIFSDALCCRKSHLPFLMKSLIPPSVLFFHLWFQFSCAAAAAKSLQSCPTLCEPVDGSPPGSPVPGIL